MSGRILIIDDQDDVRLALQTMLSLDGWDTEEAASGEEAVAQVGRTPDFDALVVDYKMPDLDGIEVTRRIRGSGFERPIIICSAYLNPEVEHEASALGAHTVSKDDLEDLRATIRRQVSTSGHETRLENSHVLAAIVESSEDAIVGKTLEGIVQSWNPAAERIYGYSAQEMIGKPVWILVPADHGNDVPEILQRVGRGEKIGHYETVRETKDGRLIDVALTISPIKDGQGNVVGASTIARDVTARRRAEGLFRGLLESSPNALVIVGPDGAISLVTRQTEELFGYSREELLGEPMEMLVPERFRNRHPHHRDRYFADPKARPMGAGLELYAMRKDGTEFAVEISLSPLEIESGTVVSAAIRDATERKGAEEKLQRALAVERDAAERLRDLDRLKDEFLSTVSHELRTPLTAISALAEVLRGSAVRDRAQRAELLERIFHNASQMGGMIEQLLDYSRLEAGKVSLEISPLPLLDAVVHCIDRAEGAISPRQTSLEVPDDLKVQADERGFERILVNLLTNAAKYSPEDSTIRVTARAENGEATIAVKDEGIGISPAEQPQVFERFYQGSMVSGTRGTGVGLSIVRRYVELQGGEVWVESQPGRGATFLFKLPLATGSNERNEAHRSVG